MRILDFDFKTMGCWWFLGQRGSLSLSFRPQQKSGLWIITGTSTSEPACYISMRSRGHGYVGLWEGDNVYYRAVMYEYKDKDTRNSKKNVLFTRPEHHHSILQFNTFSMVLGEANISAKQWFTMVVHHQTNDSIGQSLAHIYIHIYIYSHIYIYIFFLDVHQIWYIAQNIWTSRRWWRNKVFINLILLSLSSLSCVSNV